MTVFASNIIISGAKKTDRTPATKGVTLLRIATSFSVIFKSAWIDKTAAGIDPPSTLTKKEYVRKVNMMKRRKDRAMSVRSSVSSSCKEGIRVPRSRSCSYSFSWLKELLDFELLTSLKFSGSTKICLLASSLWFLRGSAGRSTDSSIIWKPEIFKL